MSTKKQIVVSTPALHYDMIVGSWRTKGTSYFCADRLAIRFDIPETAKRIWIEASRTQWPDRGGLRCRIDASYGVTGYQDEFGYEELLYSSVKELRRLLGMQPGKPETIYWRLTYEE